MKLVALRSRCILYFIILFAGSCLFGCTLCIRKPSIERQAFETRIRDGISYYKGTPYRFGGCSKHGIDCSCYVMKLYERAGIRIPRTVDAQKRGGKKVGRDDLKFGDLVFFKIGRKWQCLWLCKKDENHVGLYIGNGRFTHASVSKGVTVSRLDVGYWNERYSVAKRYFDK